MEITVYRDNELSREIRQLPAATYNLARTLLARSPAGVLFVPIRSMQFLAILDKEEFVFIDNQYKSWVEVAWQHFQPNKRAALEDPVEYEAVFYHPDAVETMKRLQAEFPRALQVLEAREKLDGPAKVLKLQGKRSF